MSLTREPGQQKYRTICEVHREMYQEIQRLPNTYSLDKLRRGKLLELLKTAFGMGKKMTNRLRKYKYDYDEGWWEEHRMDGGEISEPQPELPD